MSGDRSQTPDSLSNSKVKSKRRSANKVWELCLHPSKGKPSLVESPTRFQGVSGHDAIKFQVLIHRKGLSSMISQVLSSFQVFRTLTFYKSKNIH